MWDWITANVGPISSALFALLLGWFVARLASRAIKSWLPMSRSARNVAPLLSQAVRYGIIIFAIVTALTFLGVPSASIITVVGAAGLAIALALQNTLSNIAAGIMLIWLRPIAIGEYIVGDGIAGVVVEIGLFGTRLRSTSGLYIFTPNLQLWNGAITNHSREPRRRIDVNINGPDSINMGLARKTMLKIATSDKRVHPDPAPEVHVDSFAGDRVILQLRAWVPTPDYLPALRDVTEKTKIAINKLLAGDGEKADVSVGADPHTETDREKTPDLS